MRMMLPKAACAVCLSYATAAGCVIEQDMLRYFNIGTARFYFYRDGQMCDPEQPTDAKDTLRTLNDVTDGEPCTVYGPIRCQSGDAFILCSDGFDAYVYEEETEIDLSKRLRPKNGSDSC